MFELLGTLFEAISSKGGQRAAMFNDYREIE
jgi:hypothetical protein